MSARGNIRQPQPDVRFARIDSPMASCRDEKEETMLSGNNQAIRATLRGTAALALMAGLGMGLTGCSISIGGGSGSGSGDSGQQPAQTQGQANGGNGGQSASAPTTTGGADSAATSASGGSANSQATEIQTAGHWEIAAVWRGNQKLDLASEGMDGWYLDFYDGGYVVVHTSTGSYVSDYTSSGKTGTIKGDPSLSDSSHYDEAFEIDSTSDGSSLAMKVNYVEISPDSFRVYKRVGNAPDFASRSDIKPEVKAQYQGRTGSGSASSSSSTGTGSTASSSTNSGTSSTSSSGTASSGSSGSTGSSSGNTSRSSGSSSSSSGSSSNTPAPGTVVDGWEWV